MARFYTIGAFFVLFAVWKSRGGLVWHETRLENMELSLTFTGESVLEFGHSFRAIGRKYRTQESELQFLAVTADDAKGRLLHDPFFPGFAWEAIAGAGLMKQIRTFAAR